MPKKPEPKTRPDPEPEEVWRRRHFDEKLESVVYHIEWALRDIRQRIEQFKEEVAPEAIAKRDDWRDPPALSCATSIGQSVAQLMPSCGLHQLVSDAYRLDHRLLELAADVPPDNFDVQEESNGGKGRADVQGDRAPSGDAHRAVQGRGKGSRRGRA